MPAITKEQLIRKNALLVEQNAVLQAALTQLRSDYAEIKAQIDKLNQAPGRAEPRKAPSLEAKGAKPWSFGQVRNLFRQLRPLNKARRASYLKACANRPLEQRREIYRKLQRYDQRVAAAIAA